MHSSTQGVPHPMPPSPKGSQRSRKTDDIVYQIVTVAAILLVLGSIWVF
jgi:hypothetical protein